LKDLETKVEDLEKASESANHENSILRAQIEKMSMELREYRKRLSLTGGLGRTPSLNKGVPPYLAGTGLSTTAVNNPSDVSFQFEFPRFGRLPGPSSTSSTNLNGIRNSASPSVATQQISSPVEKDQVSPRNQSMPFSTGTGSHVGLTQTPTQLDGGDMSSLSGLFSPSLLESIGKSPPFEFFSNTNKKNTNGSMSSTDSANMSTGHNTTYSSPSASSNSNHGPSSSCGTSPEPTMQSPNYSKAADTTLTTIGEEQSGTLCEGELTFCDKLNMACGNPNNPVPRTMSEFGINAGNFDNPAFDINGIDWFAQQNGNQFDPQLFGDYREPQENILASEAFTDNFFSEAYTLPDFNSPYNMPPSPAPPKKELVQQIDEKQTEEEEVVPGEDRTQMLTCNTIWYAPQEVSVY
jgi:AP-1-like factor